MSEFRQGGEPAAVLVGLDTLQGLQAARILAGRRVPVIGLARDAGHPACRTRVCQRILYCDTGGPALVEALADLVRSLPARAVLFPCHDQAVAVVSAHRAELAQWYEAVLPAPSAVELLLDKDRFYDFAVAAGFRVPRLRRLHGPDDAVAAAEALRFPCILKPARHSDVWRRHTTAKALRVDTPGDFRAAYQRVRSWTQVLIIQELIPGGDDELYSCNCYFDRAGQLAGSFVARKLRQWPPGMGSSCLGQEVRNDEVRDETLRLFRLLRYQGLGYVEMKRDPRTGDHYLIEANVGRPTGRSAIAEAGGVRLLEAMYCDALDRPMPADMEQRYQGVKWLDLRHDCQSAWYYWRRGELGITGWLASLRGRKVHAVFSWTDPAPFLWDLWRSLRIALSRPERTRRRAAFNGSRSGPAVASRRE
jgi:predicted ATP-grasp superfamily ATP-dependent carboligase